MPYCSGREQNVSKYSPYHNAQETSKSTISIQQGFDDIFQRMQSCALQNRKHTGQAQPRQTTESTVVPPPMSVIPKQQIPVREPSRDNLEKSDITTMSTPLGNTITVDTASRRGPGVLRVERPGLEPIEIPLDENMRINESSDGSLRIFFANSGEVWSFDAEGNKTVSMEEGSAELVGTDGDDILINLTASRVSGDDGNDLIINVADNVLIEGGKGDDTIRLHGSTSSGLTVDAGEGNDIVRGMLVKDSHISTGDGNDEVNLLTFDASSLDVGQGNNIISMRTLLAQAGIHGGDGNNSLNITDVAGHINLGHGNNRLEGYAVTRDAQVNLGNGLNSLTFYSVEGNSVVNMGNGHNDISVYRVTDNSTVNMGDGHNNVEFYAVQQNAVVTMGHGNNRVQAYEINENAVVSMGDGNNRAGLHEIEDNAALNMGNGNNRLDIGKRKGRLSYQDDELTVINVGNGNNVLNLGYMRNNSTINVGDGNNVISYSDSDNATLNVGAGKNVVEQNNSTYWAWHPTFERDHGMPEIWPLHMADMLEKNTSARPSAQGSKQPRLLPLMTSVLESAVSMKNAKIVMQIGPIDQLQQTSQIASTASQVTPSQAVEQE